MRKSVVVLLLAAARAAVAADAPISPVEFTQHFVAKLREMAPTYGLTAPRELQVVLKETNGLERTIFLYDAYREYALSPQDENRIIRKYLAGRVAPKDEIRKVDRSRVVPIVKMREWLEKVRTVAQAKGAVGVPEIVSEDLNEQLMIVYAEDNPSTLRYLLPEQVAELGVKREDLRALAVANLKALLPKIEIRPSPLVIVVKAGDNYEASLLVVPDFWTTDRFKVDGDIVVAIPARDHLMVTGSANAAGLAKLRELAARIGADSSNGLTAELFVYRNGRFELFKD